MVIKEMGVVSLSLKSSLMRSYFIYSLYQDDDSPSSITNSYCNLGNQYDDLESFIHVESLDERYPDHCVYTELHDDDCPSLMDDSLFSQEESNLQNFQLESYLIVEEFLTGISFPVDHILC